LVPQRFTALGTLCGPISILQRAGTGGAGDANPYRLRSGGGGAAVGSLIGLWAFPRW
jgi:hypothetical protein